MNASNLSRRTFVKSAAAAAATATISLLDASAAGVSWPIGCFNRPWMQKFGHQPQPVTTPQPANWGFDAALKGMREAGYAVAGLLTSMPEEPFIAADATDTYLADLKRRVAAAGLTATMGALRIDFALSLPDAIRQVRRQIEHARFLNLQWLLTFGADHEEDYGKFYRTMADAADYAQERKIKLVLKPHGGGSGASGEILRCLKEVNRPNFKIWYDAGNIIYYTGKDPVEELKPIAGHVTGFCAKDCAQPKGDVMIQFGTGKVDFSAVYKELKKAGFNGPTFVEGAGGRTFQEVTGGARANRIFLEKIFASL
ncbi:MAG: sugar phosphate isomerase/epimerase family protein [Verrucomicrobiota bacterium]